MADIDEEAPGLDNVDVLTKYKTAADIANRALKSVIEACKAGATVVSLCKLGDDELTKGTATVYNKKVEGKAIEKGIAFPTCVSVNNCVCHCSPLESDPEVLLKDGDVVKIDLGAHIDGYIAPAGATLVVGASAANPATGRQADCVAAAHAAAEVALRLMKPGNSTADVTKAMTEVAKDFDCLPIEGMLSHQLERNVIDGEKAIISNPSEQTKREHKESVFAVHEAYALDVFASTGDGKARPGEQRTTVFKRTDVNYMLKIKASRMLFSEVTKKFTVMPFSIRSCEDEKKARLGLTECISHGVLQPFDLLWEKEGSFVAQFKMLVLIMPNGTVRATGVDFDAAAYKTEHSVSNEEYKKLLSTSIGAKNKKKKNNKKKTGGAAAAAAAAAEEK